MIIVTGLPRSGTSITMRLLESVGCVPVMSQSTDKNNPDGYYEGNHTNQGLDTSRFSDIYVAKVILYSMPLCNLNQNDLVIFCIRNPYEVAYSQAKDGGKFGSEQPKRNLDAYARNIESFLEWKKDRKFRLMVLDHAKLLNDPISTVKELTDFVGLELDDPAIRVTSELVTYHKALDLYRRLIDDRI